MPFIKLHQKRKQGKMAQEPHISPAICPTVFGLNYLSRNSRQIVTDVSFRLLGDVSFRLLGEELRELRTLKRPTVDVASVLRSSAGANKYGVCRTPTLPHAGQARGWSGVKEQSSNTPGRLSR